MTKKLLLIDDDSNNCTLVRVGIGKVNNWQVATCASEQALTLAKGAAWDVILLEIALYRGDGFKLFHQLQSDPETQAIPIIFLTSRVMLEEIAQYTELNIVGVIAKPFNPFRLADKVAEKMDWAHLSTY